METLTKKKAESILKTAVGGVEAFNKLIKYSRGYDLLTSEQKEMLLFLRKCYRAEASHLENAITYALTNYHVNFDHLIKNFKL